MIVRSAIGFGVFSVLMDVLAQHTTGAISTAGDIGAVVGAAVAVILLLAAVVRWAYRARHSFTTSFTYGTFRRENRRRREVFPYGEPFSDLFVHIRVTAAPIDFGEVTVRPLTHDWKLSWDPLPPHKQFGEPKGVRVLSLRNALQDQAPEGDLFPHLANRPHDDERGGVASEFFPTWRRGRDRPVVLRVEIQSDGPWNGQLGVQAPTANGGSAWRYLTIEAVDPAGFEEARKCL